MTEFIVLFQKLGIAGCAQLEFESDLPAENFIQLIMLDGYYMYQYIQAGNIYVMLISKLKENQINFEQLYRIRIEKTWFGFATRTVRDLLIMPNQNFYYPHEFGSYLYIFTKQLRSKAEIEIWLDNEFSNRYADINEEFTGFKNLMNPEDYLIATNHDLQHQFGVIGGDDKIAKIITKFKNTSLKGFDLEYNNE
ncbi:hypothetical protein [Zunongwangia atlantica]|uniref:Uncharacterized protein n=1 Tax=Zunongwangia atlantica 22II14-10F7 TaxID=1185767 RepID=A0A1Y1T6I5_9FLAO|nr:hypothetical protein [Zunongwangia atlantica]ORL46332.1 hypothetical protein IIF7_07171 [Zunongwangia atlantica 22II14-10F7]